VIVYRVLFPAIYTGPFSCVGIVLPDGGEYYHRIKVLKSWNLRSLEGLPEGKSGLLALEEVDVEWQDVTLRYVKREYGGVPYFETNSEEAARAVFEAVNASFQLWTTGLLSWVKLDQDQQVRLFQHPSPGEYQVEASRGHQVRAPDEVH